MAKETHTCEELIKSGDENPCIIRIQEDVKHIRQDFIDFQEYYKIAHKDLADAVKTTNGHIADILIWKERITGGAIFAVSLGLINWLGKYVVAFLERSV